MLSKNCARLVTVTAMFCLGQEVQAQTQVPAPPIERPVISIPRLQAPPTLEDFVTMRPATEVAGSMARVEGFITRQPTDGQPARQQTVVYLGYTNDALHAVFVAFDPEPSRVQAHLTRREEVFAVNDDAVELRVDTFNDRRRSYYFVSNALGVQLDASWPEVGGQYDESFDAVWQSRGQRTEQGFVVLMSLPFSSLRFAAGEEQTWAVYFGRWVGRSGEWSFWPTVSARQGSYLAQMATLTGIRGVQTGRNAQLIPYASYRGFRALDRRDPLAPKFVTDSMDPSVGVDAKVVVDDRFVVDLAANPDFSQVESDAPQITTNQRFELFFPEKRPFFLENAGYFQTPANVVFTRRIADPSVGARITGKAGAWTIGALVANDQAPGRSVAPSDPAAGRSAWSSVARVTRDFGAQSSVGVLSTARRLDGQTTAVFSADVRVRLSRTLVFTSQGATSTDPADGGERGTLFQATLAKTGRAWFGRTNFVARSPGFRADLGFIPRVDIRDLTHTVSYRRHRTGVVQSFGPDLAMGRTWSYDGIGLDHVIQPGVTINLARLSTLTANVSIAAQGFRAGELRNLTTFRSFDTTAWTVGGNTQPQRWLSLSATFSGGRAVNFSPAGDAVPETGDTRTANLTVGLRPTQATRLDGMYLRTSFTAKDAAKIFTSHVVRGKLSWQLTREWSARAVVQYDNTSANAAMTRVAPRRNVNLDVLVTRLVNPWTALYAGLNTNAQNIALEPTATGTHVVLRQSGLTADTRQVFVKVSYLLR